MKREDRRKFDSSNCQTQSNNLAASDSRLNLANAVPQGHSRITDKSVSQDTGSGKRDYLRRRRPVSPANVSPQRKASEFGSGTDVSWPRIAMLPLCPAVCTAR